MADLGPTNIEGNLVIKNQTYTPNMSSGGTSSRVVVLDDDGILRYKINASSSGTSGSSGPSGAIGPIGPTGPTGPIGPSGASGPIGPTGPSGASGPIGPTGPSGASGPIGPSGPIGIDGAVSGRWHFTDGFDDNGTEHFTLLFSGTQSYNNVYQILINYTTYNNINFNNWLVQIDSHDQNARDIYITLTNVYDNSNYAIYKITQGTIYMYNTTFEVVLTHISGNGNFPDGGDLFSISFMVCGANGANGANGTGGTSGTSGTSQMIVTNPNPNISLAGVFYNNIQLNNQTLSVSYFNSIHETEVHIISVTYSGTNTCSIQLGTSGSLSYKRINLASTQYLLAGSKYILTIKNGVASLVTYEQS